MYRNQQQVRAPAANYYYEMDEAMSEQCYMGGGDSSDKPTNLIVNYIPQHCTEHNLKLLFSEVGEIEHIRIMKDYKTGYSFGFGFVKYYKPEDAAKAIEQYNGFNFYNKRLKVSYARPQGEDNKDTNLYVMNLPRDVTDKLLDDLFGEFGPIVQKAILKDKITGMPRGVAFVRFAKRDDAQRAMHELNGKHLPSCMEPLIIKVAEEHGKQKAQYIDGYRTGFQMGYGNQYRGGQVGGRGHRGRAFHHGGGYRGGGGNNRFYNQNIY